MTTLFRIVGGIRAGLFGLRFSQLLLSLLQLTNGVGNLGRDFFGDDGVRGGRWLTGLRVLGRLLQLLRGAGRLFGGTLRVVRLRRLSGLLHRLLRFTRRLLRARCCVTRGLCIERR